MPTGKSKSSPQSGTIEVQNLDGKKETVNLDRAREILAGMVNEKSFTKTKDRTHTVCLCPPGVWIETTSGSVVFRPGNQDNSEDEIKQLREMAIQLVRGLDGKYRLIVRCVGLKDIFRLSKRLL